jgi:hypothetical protein
MENETRIALLSVKSIERSCGQAMEDCGMFESKELKRTIGALAALIIMTIDTETIPQIEFISKRDDLES